MLGGNPLAAMPSLHFATSLMAAHLLSELGPVHGAVGWTYCVTLGIALVYLGEHYVIDLLAGAALTETIRPPRAAAGPAARRGLAGDSSTGSAGAGIAMDKVTRTRAPPRPSRPRTRRRRTSRRGDAARRHVTRRSRDRLRRSSSRRRRFLYFVLPKLAGLDDTWDEIQDGDPEWLVAALCFELLSFGGYVILFRVVFARGETPDRLARELRDHDGRPGRHAPVRRRRRRRHRADRVGAAALGDGSRDAWPAG